MKRHLTSLVAGVLAGAALTGGAAIAITSNAFTYAAAKTGYVALSPMALAPDSVGSTAPNDYLNAWGGGLNSTDGSRCFNAGVQLPNGAKIQSMRVYYASGPITDLEAHLVRVNPSNGNNTNLISLSPANDSAARTSAQGSVPSTKRTVNNGSFQYGVGVCPTDDTTFYGARITYTYRNAGD